MKAKAEGKGKGKGKGSDSDVDALMRALKHARKSEIEAARVILRGADARVVEEVKWNAPSYRIGDVFFATFHLRAPEVVVVFHTGAKVKANPKAFADAINAALDDASANGLKLEWRGKDRCVVTVEQGRALAKLARAWIAQL